MNKYYKIGVFYFDIYDIYSKDKIYISSNHEEIIVKKTIQGYKEIVTNKIIPEKSIIDVNGHEIYDTQLGIYFTKKGITNEIRTKGYIFGTDIDFDGISEVKTLDEIKEYLEYYKVNRLKKMLKKIQSIKYENQKNKKVINNLVTVENVKKLVKEYKYGNEE